VAPKKKADAPAPGASAAQHKCTLLREALLDEYMRDAQLDAVDEIASSVGGSDLDVALSQSDVPELLIRLVDNARSEGPSRGEKAQLVPPPAAETGLAALAALAHLSRPGSACRRAACVPAAARAAWGVLDAVIEHKASLERAALVDAGLDPDDLPGPSDGGGGGAVGEAEGGGGDPDTDTAGVRTTAAAVAVEAAGDTARAQAEALLGAPASPLGLRCLLLSLAALCEGRAACAEGLAAVPLGPLVGLLGPVQPRPVQLAACKLVRALGRAGYPTARCVVKAELFPALLELTRRPPPPSATALAAAEAAAAAAAGGGKGGGGGGKGKVKEAPVAAGLGPPVGEWDLRGAAAAALAAVCAPCPAAALELGEDLGAVPDLLSMVAEAAGSGVSEGQPRDDGAGGGDDGPDEMGRGGGDRGAACAEAVGLLAIVAGASRRSTRILWERGGYDVLRALLPRVPLLEPPVADASSGGGGANGGADGVGSAGGGKSARVAAGSRRVQSAKSQGRASSRPGSARAPSPDGGRGSRIGPSSGTSGPSGTVASPTAPHPSSLVHCRAIAALTALLAMPELRDTIVDRERAAVVEWRLDLRAMGLNPDDPASWPPPRDPNAEDEAGAAEPMAPPSPGGSDVGRAAVGPSPGSSNLPRRRATLLEALFYLIQPPAPATIEVDAADAAPPPTTVRQPPPGVGAAKGKGGKAPLPPKGGALADAAAAAAGDAPLPPRPLPAQPSAVRAAAAACLEALAMSGGAAAELAQGAHSNDLRSLISDLEEGRQPPAVAERLLLVACAVLAHTRPSLLEEMGLGRALRTMARAAAADGTGGKGGRATIGRATMALRPDYPTRPPPPAPPPRPPPPPVAPVLSLWEQFSGGHLASGLAQRL